MRIAIACSVVLGALALLPWDAAAKWAEKKVLTLGIARKIFGACQRAWFDPRSAFRDGRFVKRRAQAFGKL